MSIRNCIQRPQDPAKFIFIRFLSAKRQNGSFDYGENDYIFGCDYGYSETSKELAKPGDVLEGCASEMDDLCSRFNVSKEEFLKIADVGESIIVVEDTTLIQFHVIGGEIKYEDLVELGDNKYVHIWSVEGTDERVSSAKLPELCGWAFSEEDAYAAAMTSQKNLSLDGTYTVIRKVSTQREPLPEALYGCNLVTDNKYRATEKPTDPVDWYDLCMRFVYCEIHEYSPAGDLLKTYWETGEGFSPNMSIDAFLDPETFKRLIKNNDPIGASDSENTD